MSAIRIVRMSTVALLGATMLLSDSRLVGGEIDAPAVVAPSLQFELDLSQQELRDLSGNNNTVQVVGELPIVQNGRQFSRQGFIDIPPSEALHCDNTAWTAEATVIPDANDVQARDVAILTHGGSQDGYALALRDGIPEFVIVANGRRHVVRGTERITGRTTLTGIINAQRRASLEVNGVEVDFLLLPGLMGLPEQGMQIGSDQGVRVNDPRLLGFIGVIERVRIYRGVPSR
jgi:hypothetical protein